MRITVLAGGVGGARFLRGLRALLEREHPGSEITVIGNTGDDIWVHGLRVCPDLDTVMYTLGNGISEERGWGREAETFTVKEELAAYGLEPSWFGLGDRDIATHLVRTQMLNAGYPLSAITEALCERWQPGVRLLPMSDERAETHVVVDDPAAPSVLAVDLPDQGVPEEPGLAHHEGGGLGEDPPGPRRAAREGAAAERDARAQRQPEGARRRCSLCAVLVRCHQLLSSSDGPQSSPALPSKLPRPLSCAASFIRTRPMSSIGSAGRLVSWWLSVGEALCPSSARDKA